MSETDDELLGRTPRDPEAFTEFYRRHERAVIGYFMRRTRDAEVAADLTAETFATAVVSAKRFRPGREPAIAWLFGIARHSFKRALTVSASSTRLAGGSGSRRLN